MAGPLRVLHCPSMVAGNPQQLARSERAVGLHSWSVAFYQSPFGYLADEVLFSDADTRLRREVKRWRLLWRALRHFDVVHYNFGQTIMPQWMADGVVHFDRGRLCQAAVNFMARLLEMRDVAWLRRAGKRIFVTFQGDDARQGDYCRKNFEITFATEVDPEYYSPTSDRRKRERIATFARYADRIFALNPDLLHVLPSNAQFLPYCHVDLTDWKVVRKETSPRPIVIHAPSHRGVKGTRFVLEVVSRLKAEGLQFEFVQVENLRNAEARKEYERADILVDQLLAGWYGGVAVELMALGKPVICYLRDGDLKFIPEAMRRELPIIQATPATISHVLREWLTVQRHEISKAGIRARAFVERWHDPLKIAERMMHQYEAAIISPEDPGPEGRPMVANAAGRKD